MRKVLIILLVLLIIASLAGCSSEQKSAEELKAEIKAEMEAEAKLKEKLKEELKEEMEKEKEKENLQASSKPSAVSNGNIKNEQVVQETGENPKEQETKVSLQPEKVSTVLIESDEAQGYFKYKTNVTVNFDIDGDGIKEEIKYDATNGKLNVSGYKAVDIDAFPFGETEYFIIIEFKDKFDTEMNMIGIIDYGPSSDPTTTLYSIIAPMGEKWFGSVGTVPGEIVPPSKYNEHNMDDFNYKAVLKKGSGIEAPVRLSVGNQTWFGRNLFTYYSTYNSLIDNIEKYEQDYETRSELMVEKDVKAYSEKDTSSESIIIKAGYKAHLVFTDNKEWIYMFSEADLSGGWVKVTDVTESNFSGFVMFD